MDQNYAGVLAVPFIAGMIEGMKRFGLDTKWAFPVSLSLGLLLSLAYCYASGPSDIKTWLDAGVIGLGLGLSASGLYSGVKNATGN